MPRQGKFITYATFQARVEQWAREKLTGLTVEGQLKKLRKEAVELIEAIDAGDTDRAIVEAGDVWVVNNLLTAMLGRDVFEALGQKQAKNERRQWVCKDGHAQHVEPTTSQLVPFGPDEVLVQARKHFADSPPLAERLRVMRPPPVCPRCHCLHDLAIGCSVQ